MTISELISTGFGSGKVARAPGTVGSIVAYCLWLVLQTICSYELLVVLTLTTIVIGLIAIDGYLNQIVKDTAAANSLTKNQDQHKGIDPKEVVIDEWAGLFLGLILISIYTSESTYLLDTFLCLIFFRVFDILKPGPVRLAEQLPRQWGIMLDDLVAGLLAFLTVVLLKVFF